jgi:hypothetical protein
VLLVLTGRLIPRDMAVPPAVTGPGVDGLSRAAGAECIQVCSPRSWCAQGPGSVGALRWRPPRLWN